MTGPPTDPATTPRPGREGGPVEHPGRTPLRGGWLTLRVGATLRPPVRDRSRRPVSGRVADELVPDEGEYVVDEVRHHWVLLVPRALEVLGTAATVALAGLPHVPWEVVLPGLALAVHAAWRTLVDHMDRFVITNLRVFRVQGVVSRTTSTMPIQRILDITVTTPVPGRLLGYGHFVFESAAQEQGLRDIRYIGSPHERDLTMQRVIQQAGLRRGLSHGSGGGDGGGDGPRDADPDTRDRRNGRQPSAPRGRRDDRDDRDHREPGDDRDDRDQREDRGRWPGARSAGGAPAPAGAHAARPRSGGDTRPASSRRRRVGFRD